MLTLCKMFHKIDIQFCSTVYFGRYQRFGGTYKSCLRCRRQQIKLSTVWNCEYHFTILDSSLHCEIWRALLRNFFRPSVTLLLSGSSIMHVYAVYLTWKWRLEAGTRRFPCDNLRTLICWFQPQLPSLRPFPVFHSRTCFLHQNHMNFLLGYNTPIWTLKVSLSKSIRKWEFLR